MASATRSVQRLRNSDRDVVSNLTDQGKLTLKGGLAAGLVTITNADSPYTVGSELTVLVDCTDGAVTVIPPDATVETRLLNVKKIDSSGNAVTIDPVGSQTVDGSSTATISIQYGALSLHSDLSNYHVI